MDVEGRDHAPEGHGLDAGGRRGPGRPRPTLHTHAVVAVPKDWPEHLAYRTGVRLYVEGNDAVWVHIRGGHSLHEDLTPQELAAQVQLGTGHWERWFTLGWTRAADADEGG